MKKWTPANGEAVKARKPKIDWEGNEQTMFFTWLRMQHPFVFSMTYHPPNGGFRSKPEAARFKAQGVKAGVPDICIAVARGGYFGLYIEFKATPPKDSVVSPAQKEWLIKLEMCGYKAVLCKGFDSIKAEVESYLKMPTTEGR